MELFLTELETPRGVFLLLFHGRGIYELYFPDANHKLNYPRKHNPWPGLETELKRYFQGETVSWEAYPLDRSGYGPFTGRLLEVVRRLPYGSVCTYREAARQAGSPKAWRAAGQALSVNRHPLLIPCHRVIRSDGSCGGFSGPAGWKEELLKLEGALPGGSKP